MKKWLVTIAALWLAGCSSGEINKNYYQLPVVQSGTQSTASQGNRLLWVEQVAVPDYLAGNGVVYQTSDVKYVIANNNLGQPVGSTVAQHSGCQPEHATARLGGCLPASGKRPGHAQCYRNGV